MNQYWKFDIEQFLKDSKTWKKERLQLERKIESMRGLKALSQDTPVQTSNISDTTGSTAMRVLEEDEKIKELTAKIELLDTALSTLIPKHRDVINVFFFDRRTIGAGVDMFCVRWDCKRSDCYNTRRKALDTLSAYIAERL